MSNVNEWIVTLADVPEAGLKKKFEIVGIDNCKKIAKKLEVEAVFFIYLKAHITLFQDGLHIKAITKTHVMQSCGVTLEPIEDRITEEFEITFLPNIEVVESKLLEDLDEEDIAKMLEEDDPPELLVNNEVNLLDLAIEFLSLGVNPYPRKAGAVFIDPEADKVVTPFDVLKKINAHKI